MNKSLKSLNCNTALIHLSTPIIHHSIAASDSINNENKFIKTLKFDNFKTFDKYESTNNHSNKSVMNDDSKISLLSQVLNQRRLQYASQLFTVADYDIITELVRKIVFYFNYFKKI